MIIKSNTYTVFLLIYKNSLLFLLKAAAFAALRLAYPPMSLRSNNAFATLRKAFVACSGRFAASLLRGAAPSALRLPPRVRHVAGVHGGRASPYFMPPTTKRWSLRSASRVRLRPKCSPVRCSGCALRSACGFRFRP